MCTHRQWVEGDENVCSCGLRWGADEDDPHFHNAVYELKERLLSASEFSKESVSECLAELVKQCLISDDSDPCHVYAFDFIKAVGEHIMGADK